MTIICFARQGCYKGVFILPFDKNLKKSNIGVGGIPLKGEFNVKLQNKRRNR